MDVELTRDDVVGTFAGLRPLIAPSTVRPSRRRASTGSPSRRTASCGSAAASTRPTGSWPATPSMRCSGRQGAKARPSATAERRLVGAADAGRAGADRDRARFEPGRTRGGARGGGPAGRPARDGGARRGRARRRARPAPAARAGSPLPRGRGRRGPPGTSWRRRSTTSSPGGRGWRRSCPTAGRPWRRVSPRSSPRSSAGTAARQADEIETYLATARREYSVAAPEPTAAVELAPIAVD